MDNELNNKILEALALLEVDNPEHWTTDGLPRLDVLSEITEKEIKRKMVTAIAPQFSLTNPVLPVAEAEDNWLDEKPAEQGEEPSNEGGEPTEAEKEASAPSSPEAPPAALKQPTAAVSAPTSAEHAAMKHEIDTLSASIARNRLRMDALATENKQAERLMNKKIDAMQVQFPPLSEAEAVKAHIATQHQQRIDRVESANRLKQLTGANVLQAKAPLDAAMARKTGRGHGRPHHGMLDMGNTQ